MRIRTVKPEFFQHEMHATISETAALLALGLLCYADDEGRFKVHWQSIRSMLFTCRERTADQVQAAFQELVGEGWLTPYTAQIEDRDVLLCEVTNFKRHQRINRPVKSRLPSPRDARSTLHHPLLTEDSAQAEMRAHPLLTEDSEGKGRKEGKGKEGKESPRGREEEDERDGPGPKGNLPEVNCPPSLAEVIAHGQGLVPPAPQAFCEDFHRYWQGRGWWMKPSIKMSDYRPILESRWIEELKKPRSAEHKKTAVGAAIDRRQRKAALEEIIAQHTANQESSAYNPNCTATDRKNLTQLRRELDELTAEVARG